VAHESGADESYNSEKLAGQEIRRLRMARDWTQQELARQMAAYGYDWHQTMIAKIESGARPLRVNELTAFAELFGVYPAHLITPHVSMEEAEAEIARLEPAARDAQAELDAAEKIVEDMGGDLQAAAEARDAAFFELRRITARLDYLRQRQALLAGSESS
jgi:transcriptional regulator with XRE-family HTH domain